MNQLKKLIQSLKFIKHVHIKDSVMEEGMVKYKMTGYGDVPVAQAVKLLAKIILMVNLL